MKITRLLSTLLLFGLPFMNACSDDDPVVEKNKLDVTPPKHEIAANNTASHTFKVETDATSFNYEITAGNGNWIEHAKTENGFTVKAKTENEQEDTPREVTFKVTAGTADPKEVKFIQLAPGVEPTEYEFSLKALGHTVNFENAGTVVPAEGYSDGYLRWEVETNIEDAKDIPVTLTGDWNNNSAIKAAFAMGTLSDEDKDKLYLKITIGENTAEEEREGKLRIDLSEYIDAKVIEWNIKQAGAEPERDPYFEVTPFKHDFIFSEETTIVRGEGYSDDYLRWEVSTNIPEAENIEITPDGAWRDESRMRVYFAHGSLADEDPSKLYIKMFISENPNSWSDGGDITIDLTEYIEDEIIVWDIQQRPIYRMSIQADGHDYVFTEMDGSVIPQEGVSLEWTLTANFGAMAMVPVSADGAWSDADDFEVRVDNNYGQFKIVMNIGPNTTGDWRSGNVTIDVSQWIEDANVIWYVAQSPDGEEEEGDMAGTWRIQGADIAPLVGLTSEIPDSEWRITTQISKNAETGYWEIANFANLGIPLQIEERDGKYYFKNKLEVQYQGETFYQRVALLDTGNDLNIDWDVDMDEEFELTTNRGALYFELGVEMIGDYMPRVAIVNADRSRILCLTDVEATKQ